MEFQMRLPDPDRPDTSSWPLFIVEWICRFGKSWEPGEDVPPFQYWEKGIFGATNGSEAIYTWQALIKAPHERHVRSVIRTYFVRSYVNFCYRTAEEFIDWSQFPNCERRFDLTL